MPIWYSKFIIDPIGVGEGKCPITKTINPLKQILKIIDYFVLTSLQNILRQSHIKKMD